jgi:hypothetical protein
VAATTKEEDVTSRDDGRRRHRTPIERLTPEQLARAHENAQRWRAELRSEAALEAVPTLPSPAPPDPAPKRPAPAKDEARRRADFAAAVARAEFGRFYRIGRLDRDAKMPPPERANDTRRKP